MRIIHGHKKSFLVIGLGRFGGSFARHISKMGCEVVAVDDNEEKVKEIADCVSEAFSGNINSEEFLKSIGVDNFDAVVVAVGQNIGSSVLITTIIKELGAKYIISRANDDLHEKILQKIGADWVVTVERDMGKRIASSLYSGKVIDSLELSPDFKFVELEVLSKWVGQKIGDVKLFKNHDLMLAAIKHDNEIISHPDNDTFFEKGDIIVVYGKTKSILQIG
jgi:trk system potassium uptake protein